MFIFKITNVNIIRVTSIIRVHDNQNMGAFSHCVQNMKLFHNVISLVYSLVLNLYFVPHSFNEANVSGYIIKYKLGIFSSIFYFLKLIHLIWIKIDHIIINTAVLSIELWLNTVICLCDTCKNNNEVFWTRCHSVYFLRVGLKCNQKLEYIQGMHVHSPFRER